jgi:NTE family protein
MAINGNTKQSKAICNVVIEPKKLDQFSSFEIAKAKEIFDIGYQFTIENFTPADFQKQTT